MGCISGADSDFIVKLIDVYPETGQRAMPSHLVLPLMP
jgi:hypothetical protein